MAMIECPECHAAISEKAFSCPHCGHPMVHPSLLRRGRLRWGYEWKSQTAIFGIPLIHLAIGWNQKTGKLMVAKGIIAIGQFGIGLITIAQFGIGFLFGIGQVVSGMVCLGQVALAFYFGAGQIATGLTAIGQLAFGNYVLAQIGSGTHVWSTKVKDPEAVAYFQRLWESLKQVLPR